jgi:ribosomal protein L11
VEIGAHIPPPANLRVAQVQEIAWHKSRKFNTSAEQTSSFAVNLTDQSVNLKQVVEELNQTVKGKAA